jgi:hypothetical protein
MSIRLDAVRTSLDSMPVQTGIVSLAVIEKRAILEAFLLTKGDCLQTSKLLGIGKTSLYRKLNAYFPYEDRRRLAFKSVLEAAKDFISLHPDGCCLRFFFFDGFLKSGTVAYCQKMAKAKGHDDCERTAQLLLGSSAELRRKVYKQCRLL